MGRIEDAVRAAAVALALATIAGCGDRGEGDDDDAVDPCQPGGLEVLDPASPAAGMDFALGPLLEDLSGTFSGQVDVPEGPDAGTGPLTLTVSAPAPARVVYGSDACADPAYRVALRLVLDAPDHGIDAVAEVDAVFAQPVLQLALNDEAPIAGSGVTLSDPAMADGDDVVVTLSCRFDGAGWAGDVTWRFAAGGFDPEGTLATWTATR